MPWRQGTISARQAVAAWAYGGKCYVSFLPPLKGSLFLTFYLKGGLF
jgi:hypothetical protein